MTPKDRIFEPKQAKVLLGIAEAELEMAEIVISSGKGRRESILFMLQQCIEKSLKAALIRMELPVPFVHDLAALVARFPLDRQPPGGYRLGDLTPFATVRRYEEGVFALTQEDVEEALAMTTQVIQWAKRCCEAG